MPHWSDAYLNIPHDTLDCAELVEKTLAEVFGKNIRFPRKSSADIDHRSGLIVRHARDFARRIEQPRDGCGVLMFARGRRAHMGLYCAIAQGYVLHSHSLFGASMIEPVNRIRFSFKIEGFYDWLD